MKARACAKTYGDRRVLQTPELQFQRGRIYAVIGANGSGKTTFSKILAGIIRPDDRKPVVSDDISVGYMNQQHYAFRMSTRANILLACKDAMRADNLMRMLQLTELADQRAGKLSGGELARMVLAQILMKRYDLLILDEPTAAMDVETALIAEQVITRYCEETNCALLLVTHSLQQARRMADEVLFFCRGELLEQGEKSAVLDSPREEKTKQFLDFYGV